MPEQMARISQSERLLKVALKIAAKEQVSEACWSR